LAPDIDIVPLSQTLDNMGKILLLIVFLFLVRTLLHLVAGARLMDFPQPFLSGFWTLTIKKKIMKCKKKKLQNMCLYTCKLPLNCAIHSFNKAICLGMIRRTQTPGDAQPLTQAKIDL